MRFVAGFNHFTLLNVILTNCLCSIIIFCWFIIFKLAFLLIFLQLKRLDVDCSLALQLFVEGLTQIFSGAVVGVRRICCRLFRKVELTHGISFYLSWAKRVRLSNLTRRANFLACIDISVGQVFTLMSKRVVF